MTICLSNIFYITLIDFVFKKEKGDSKMEIKNIGLNSATIKYLKEETINNNLPVFLELRSSENGRFPYSYFVNTEEEMYSTEMEINKNHEKQRLVDVASKFATSCLGIQLLTSRIIQDGEIDYYSSFIDFIDGHANRQEFLKSISFLSNVPNNFIEKMKSDICSQVVIAFPKKY